MKILRVIVSEDTIALEFEGHPGYPETFTCERKDLGEGSIDSQVSEVALKLKDIWESALAPEAEAERLRSLAEKALE